MTSTALTHVVLAQTPGTQLNPSQSQLLERLRPELLREAQRDSRSALERIEQVAQWKVRHRAALTRMRVKRGAEADRG